MKDTHGFVSSERKSVSLLAAGASLLPVSQAAEHCEAGEARHSSSTSGLWADQGWLLLVLLLAGLVCLLHVVKDLGWEMVRRWWLRRETQGEAFERSSFTSIQGHGQLGGLGSCSRNSPGDPTW